jgi:hypothetical protein
MVRYAPQRQHIALILILLVAALFRAWLIAVDGAAFESDEAIVGLMARHINQGEALPTFFYGQAYMGSLDAMLVAGGFQALGESVDTIRTVQAVLYLLALLTGYGLAYTITRCHRIAATTLLLLAIPTALGALYTTISLGGYNEIILAGNVILLLGWQLTIENRGGGWRWSLLGFVAGIGWWTNGAIITALLVVGLMGLRTAAIRQWRHYGIAAVAFVIGSAPWWLYNLHHDWEALVFLTNGFEAEGAGSISTVEAVLGLLVLGLPALYGLRYPWAASFEASSAVIAGAVVYLVLLTDLLAGLRQGVPSRSTLTARDSGPPHRYDVWARRWVWLVFGVFGVIFLLSSFADATGRYLLPLWIPAALGVALGLDRLRRAAWWLPAGLLALLLVMQAGTVLRAARSEMGLTPQLVERLRIPPGDDARLLDWLAEHDYTRGYASYWTSFRLMFTSGETVIFDTALPHDAGGYIEGANRYAPYQAIVADAERVVWITQNFPALDAAITDRLAGAGITYQVEEIDVYRVYYDFSRRITPAELGIDTMTFPDP